MTQIQTPETGINLDSMPPEIIERIVTKLPIETIKEFCGVNKQIESLCSTNSFWKNLVKRDFNVDKLVIGVCWKYQYQLLSTQIYVYNFHTDTYDETKFFLTPEGAIKEFLHDIDIRGDLFDLDIDFTELTDVSHNVIGEMMCMENELLLKTIQTDKDKRKQYLKIRKYVHSVLRENIEEEFCSWGCYVLESESDAKYTIHSEQFNLEDEIGSNLELDFIKTHHKVDRTELVYLNKTSLELVVNTLKHYNIENCKKATLKDGRLTYWDEKNSIHTIEPLNPKSYFLFTQYLKQNASHLIET